MSKAQRRHQQHSISNVWNSNSWLEHRLLLKRVSVAGAGSAATRATTRFLQSAYKHSVWTFSECLCHNERGWHIQRSRLQQRRRRSGHLIGDVISYTYSQISLFICSVYRHWPPGIRPRLLRVPEHHLRPNMTFLRLESINQLCLVCTIISREKRAAKQSR